MEKSKHSAKILWGFLLISLSILLLILGQNVYDGLYPPVFFPQKIDVVKVKKRVEEAGLIPREALYYKAIEKDTRLQPGKEETQSGQGKTGQMPPLP